MADFVGRVTAADLSKLGGKPSRAGTRDVRTLDSPRLRLRMLPIVLPAFAELRLTGVRTNFAHRCEHCEHSRCLTGTRRVPPPLRRGGQCAHAGAQTRADHPDPRGRSLLLRSPPADGQV